MTHVSVPLARMMQSVLSGFLILVTEIIIKDPAFDTMPSLLVACSSFDLGTRQTKEQKKYFKKKSARQIGKEIPAMQDNR
jgi:hypothetical protein